MADLVITVGQVIQTDGGRAMLQAGEAITQGEPIYKKASDKKAYICISSSAAAAECIGLALCAAEVDQYVAYARDGSEVTLGAGAAPAAGEQYSVSGTAGGLQPDLDIGAGEYLCQVCYGIGANAVKLNINTEGVAHA